MPPVSGGRPGIGSVARAATVSRKASVASPVVGAPTGGSPIQWASPSRSVRDVRSTFRDLDRRLADIETHVTSGNMSLANEIEKLR